MARSILAAMLGLSLVFAGFSGTRAAAQATDTLGGTGGSASQLPCRPGELLIGIGARFGDVLDWVGPMCVTPDRDLRWAGVPDGGIYVPPAKTSFFQDVGAFYSDILPWNIPSSLAAAFTPSPTPRPGMGTSSGGSWTSYALCPQNTYVAGYDATVAGSGTGLVARITLRCSGPGGAASVGLPPPAASGGPPYYPSSGPDCPRGQLASGLRGMSGVFVDRIGLLCVQRPGEFRRAMRGSVLRAIQADARREGITEAVRRPDVFAPRPAIGPNSRQMAIAIAPPPEPPRHGVGDAIAGSPTVAGNWETNQGSATFTQSNGRLEGSYQGGSGRISALSNGSVWIGYWAQTTSARRCPIQQLGSYYWGRMAFTFVDQNRRLDGHWSYCDASPAGGAAWTGRRTQ